MAFLLAADRQGAKNMPVKRSGGVRIGYQKYVLYTLVPKEPEKTELRRGIGKK